MLAVCLLAAPRALQLLAEYRTATGEWSYKVRALAFKTNDSLATYDGANPALQGVESPLCGLETAAVNEFACDLRPAAPLRPDGGVFASFGKPA